VRPDSSTSASSRFLASLQLTRPDHGAPRTLNLAPAMTLSNCLSDPAFRRDQILDRNSAGTSLGEAFINLADGSSTGTQRLHRGSAPSRACFHKKPSLSPSFMFS
jgi:hypothetical protein